MAAGLASSNPCCCTFGLYRINFFFKVFLHYRLRRSFHKDDPVQRLRRIDQPEMKLLRRIVASCCAHKPRAIIVCRISFMNFTYLVEMSEETRLKNIGKKRKD